MAVHPLLPAPSLLSLDGINIQNGMIVFAVHSTASTVSCPLCRHGAQRPHSRYRRTVLDLPWQGNAVRIEVTCRKFFCDNRDCSRRIFAEPLPTLAARYSRKTTRLLDALRELVYLAGGEAAARIARAFGLLVSPDALLNHIRRAPSVESDEVPTPRVLGIDDFAFRRGHRYGTILVDLERHCPVDLLPDREPETVVNWLQTHPGVQIVSRDRGKAYIEGATRGAPQATQVTDRWHLLKNLGDVVERILSRHHRHLREAAGQMKGEVANNAAPAVVPITKPLVTLAQEPANQERNERCGRREATFRQVRELYRQGCNQSDISRQTGLARQTVRKYLKADTCPQYPEQRRRSNSTVVAPFASYLKRRWQAGCYNAAELFMEIREQGYRGRYTSLKDYLREWRTTHAASSSTRAVRPMRRDIPSASTVRWWMLGHLGKAEMERAWRAPFMEGLYQLCPLIQQTQVLALEFTQMVRERNVGALSAWLDRVRACGISELAVFAAGLLKDKAAVEAALSLPWSNGQVEGQVNRLKFLKRQMYGRASFDLLRARVLHQTKKIAA